MAKGTRPGRRTELVPISEINRVIEPIGTSNALGVRINPAREDGNLASILGQLNITLSALRDALRGIGTRDFTTLETDLEAVLARLDVALSTRAASAQLPTALTPHGNLRLSIAESTIKVPADIQAHLALAVVIAISAARTASGSTGDIDVGRWLVAASCIDVTAIVNMASCDIFLEGRDETSGRYMPIHSRNFTTIGHHWVIIDPLPFRLVRARWVINTPGTLPSFTASVALQGKS